MHTRLNNYTHLLFIAHPLVSSSCHPPPLYFAFLFPLHVLYSIFLSLCLLSLRLSLHLFLLNLRMMNLLIYSGGGGEEAIRPGLQPSRIDVSVYFNFKIIYGFMSQKERSAPVPRNSPQVPKSLGSLLYINNDRRIANSATVVVK